MAQYTHVLLILKTQHFNPSVYPRHDEPTRFLVDAFLTLLAPFFLFFFKSSPASLKPQMDSGRLGWAQTND